MSREFNEAEATLHRKFATHVRNAAAEAGLMIDPQGPIPPDVLDQLWSTWEWPPEMSAEEQQVAIAFSGFALGDYLAAHTGMRGQIVSDAQGTDYALVVPATDVTAFPLATVAKRLGQAPFFSSIAPAMISDIANASVRRNEKPWWKFW